MKAFNPNDFKAEPIDFSKVTINKETVTWTMCDDGVWSAPWKEVVVRVIGDVVKIRDGFKGTLKSDAGAMDISVVEVEPIGFAKVNIDRKIDTWTMRSVLTDTQDMSPATELHVPSGYYLEYVCPHCGAPGGVRRVTKDSFNDTNGRNIRELEEHNDWEHNQPIDDDACIKAVDRTCSGCGSYDR